MTLVYAYLLTYKKIIAGFAYVNMCIDVFSKPTNAIVYMYLYFSYILIENLLI